MQNNEENPNFNEILDYKTPPLTIKWILLLLRVMITISYLLYTRTPLKIVQDERRKSTPKPLTETLRIWLWLSTHFPIVIQQMILH